MTWYMLSAFGDEISPDITYQMDALEDNGIFCLELRAVGKVDVLNLEQWQHDKILRECGNRKFRFSAIGSPIGKSRIDQDFEFEWNRLWLAINLAKHYRTRFVRIFSFYPPEGGDIKEHREEVLWRLAEMAKLADQHDVTLLLENEKGLYGETWQGCLDVLKTVNHKRLRMTFDPANFVQAGQKPFDECWPPLQEYVRYFHIKDAHLADGQVVPAGEGDGQIREVLRAYKELGRKAFLSLEPHLAASGQFDGYTGPERFRTACEALKKILAELGD